MNKKAVMEKLARAAYENRSFNGVWLYAENGEIVSKGALGWADAANTVPIREDSIFEMASVTKMFTAAAVMLLVREDKLNLDDAYAKHIPEYPYPDVSIRHLLTHTSGMPDDFSVKKWVSPIWENEHRIPPCREILRFIRESEEKLDCVPGERFRYTDVGYCLLAVLVERLSGVAFEDYLKKNIFEPADMKDSAIYHTRRDGRPSDRITRNMILDENGYVPSDVSDQTAAYVVGSDGMNGCDYLYTTVFDMLKWDRALREEKVLTLEEQRIMYAPMLLKSGEISGANDDDDGYGLGLRFKTEPEAGLVVRHSGGMPGLNTWFEHFVDTDRTLIFMSCRDFADERAYQTFVQGLEDAARGNAPKFIVSIEDIGIK